MAALESTPAKGKHKQKRSAPRIDMTPMVDLAFLLLTFFVMTTTLMRNFEMEIQQPVSDQPEDKREIKAERVLNLVLGNNDKVYWYIGMPGSESTQTDFSSTGLRKLLINKKQEIKNLYVLIKGSDQARYKNMIDVLDEIAITRIVDYSIVNMEAEDRKLIQ